MGRVTVTEASYIRKLPYSACLKLRNLLDPGKEWVKLAVCVPKKLDMSKDDFEAKYNFEHIANITERGRKDGCSSTDAILSDWGTQNATIKHLIQALTEAELYAAADYISVKILNGEPVPRPQDSCCFKENNLEVGDLRHTEPTENDETVCLPKPQLHTNKSTYLCKPHESEELTVVGQDTVQHDFLEHESVAGSTGLKGENYHGEKSLQPACTLEEMIQNENLKCKRLRREILKNITDDFNNDDYSNGGCLIGKGGFGNVYVGTFPNGFKVAIKYLKEEVQDINMEKLFETELSALTEYRHNNIVQLLGYSVEDTSRCLVYQYMINGSLEDRLVCKNGTPPLKFACRVAIAKGTAEGIAYLNGQNLVHRDIKSANVLLDPEFVPKIGDFATVRRKAPHGSGFSELQETSCVIGTSAYLAPEAHYYDVSTKLDAFSFGIVLYELLTGLAAFDIDRSERDLKSHMNENCDDIVGMLDMSAGDWSEEAAIVLGDVANRCTEFKKKIRPCVSDVLAELQKLAE